MVAVSVSSGKCSCLPLIGEARALGDHLLAKLKMSFVRSSNEMGQKRYESLHL